MAERMYATGRRKTSVARVWLKPGNGQIIINKNPLMNILEDRLLSLL